MNTFINLIQELTYINQQFRVHYVDGVGIINIIQDDEVIIKIYNDDDIYINGDYYKSIDYMEIMIKSVENLENKINK